MLADGAESDSVIAAIEELVAEVTPSVRFMLGTALYEAGHATAAEQQFRSVAAAQPDNAAVQVALAEALLSQSRWDDAVEAARLADTGGLAAPAAQSLLFGAIMGGDEAAYADGVERARAAGVDSAHVRAFEAWHTAQTGGEPTRSLPLAAAPLIATILEALLRVEQFDAFEKLAPLMDACPVPGRERRELMAQIYFRRGYLESAADEWVAAVQEQGPDARALLGLAQVAYARELPEDAAVFAAEVQAIEPGHAGAARLLAAVSPAV
jgi:tetratricopeptide (TPR) repeat protein